MDAVKKRLPSGLPPFFPALPVGGRKLKPDDLCGSRAAAPKRTLWAPFDALSVHLSRVLMFELHSFLFGSQRQMWTDVCSDLQKTCAHHRRARTVETVVRWDKSAVFWTASKLLSSTKFWMGFLMTFYCRNQEGLLACECTCVCVCEMYLYLIVHKHKNKHQLNQFLLSCCFHNCIVADLFI